MFARYLVFFMALASLVSVAHAQGRRDTQALAASPAATEANNPPTDENQSSSPATSGTAQKWRTPAAPGKTNMNMTASSAAPSGVRAAAIAPPPQTSGPRQPITRVTPGSNTLPNDNGQEWRDYDISPYTARVTSTSSPQLAIRDWILRETGYEAWHGETAAVLRADHRTLSVYHTPEMHAVVSEMVDRFVNTEAESQAFGMRVITIGNPNWRAKAHRMLHPVASQSAGVQAWLLAKEDASLLLADMRKRSDFQEHSTPHLLVNNGQSTIVPKTRTRNYIRDVILNANAWPGFEPQMGQFDEGFKIEFHPLLSFDGKVIDAVLKCEVDQVEQMLQVKLDVPTAATPKQRTTIEVPQMISSRLHERFRWPADQVLLISMGVGPTPVPQAPNTLGIKVPLISQPTRADLLVFVESKGKAAPSTTQVPGTAKLPTFHGRY